MPTTEQIEQLLTGDLLQVNQQMSFSVLENALFTKIQSSSSWGARGNDIQSKVSTLPISNYRINCSLGEAVVASAHQGGQYGVTEGAAFVAARDGFSTMLISGADYIESIYKKESKEVPPVVQRQIDRLRFLAGKVSALGSPDDPLAFTASDAMPPITLFVPLLAFVGCCHQAMLSAPVGSDPTDARDAAAESFLGMVVPVRPASTVASTSSAPTGKRRRERTQQKPKETEKEPKKEKKKEEASTPQKSNLQGEGYKPGADKLLEALQAQPLKESLAELDVGKCMVTMEGEVPPKPLKDVTAAEKSKIQFYHLTFKDDPNTTVDYYRQKVGAHPAHSCMITYKPEATTEDMLKYFKTAMQVLKDSGLSDVNLEKLDLEHKITGPDGKDISLRAIACIAAAEVGIKPMLGRESFKPLDSEHTGMQEEEMTKLIDSSEVGEDAKAQLTKLSMSAVPGNP